MNASPSDIDRRRDRRGTMLALAGAGVVLLASAAVLWWNERDDYERSALVGKTVGRTPLAFDLSDSRDVSRLGTPHARTQRDTKWGKMERLDWEGDFDVAIKLPEGRVLRAEATAVSVSITDDRIRQVDVMGSIKGPPEAHREQVERQIREVRPTLSLEGRTAEQDLADWLAGGKPYYIWRVDEPNPTVNAYLREIEPGEWVVRYDMFWHGR